MAKKTYLLAIDTATRFAGLALYDGETIRAESYWQSRNNHSVELMPELVRMLNRQGIMSQDLGVVAVSMGPGSFTGLRIGLSVAKGLALAHKIPILGVPTLDVQSYPHFHQRRPIWSVIEAGRGRVCVARYERHRGHWRRRGDLELIASEGLVSLFDQPCLVCGELTPEQIAYVREHTQVDVTFAAPSQTMRRPACLAEMAWQRFERGERDDLATLSPIYLNTPQT